MDLIPPGAVSSPIIVLSVAYRNWSSYSLMRDTMVTRVRCGKCGTENYSWDLACMSCGAALNQPVVASAYHASAKLQPAPGPNTVFAAVVLIVGIATIAFTGAALLNFHSPPINATVDAPAGAVLGLPVGPALIAASVGLFRFPAGRHDTE